ncbi:MAG: phosphatidate cytidylyltransferase [Deltaproteobacteria bacterium]|nr:phosphatidate cytidylyltransferase [Deltaproteobacteria bacterium]
MTSPHAKRWITAIIALPLLVVLITFGSLTVLSAVVALISLIGLYEYHAMLLPGETRPALIEALLAAPIITFAAALGGLPLMTAVLVFTVMALFILFMQRLRKAQDDLQRFFTAVFGIIYIPFFLAFLLLLRRYDQGVMWVFYVIIITFAGDVAGFYIGRTWGKRKLVPEISAGKTQEGALGSMAGAVAASVAFTMLFLREIPPIQAIFMGFLANVMGQLGDLCESSIKRLSKVKDSGFILPGHGGLMDRLDSLLFIIPFVYLYVELVVR